MPAGFAINVARLLERPDAKFRFEVPSGNLESDFLSRVTTVQELEPRADMCSKVGV